MNDQYREYTPHAYVRMDGEGGAMVFDLGNDDGRKDFISEIVDLHDWDILDVDPADDSPAWLTVEIRPMPAGYASTLAEHPGW